MRWLLIRSNISHVAVLLVVCLMTTSLRRRYLGNYHVYSCKSMCHISTSAQANHLVYIVRNTAGWKSAGLVHPARFGASTERCIALPDPASEGGGVSRCGWVSVGWSSLKMRLIHMHPSVGPSLPSILVDLKPAIHGNTSHEVARAAHAAP